MKAGKDIIDSVNNIHYKNKELTFAARPSRSYAYCSDTAFAPSIANQIAHVDLLYHEATFMQEDEGKATETKHATAKQAAWIAKEAGVKRLILGHFSARYKDLTPLLEEAQSIFKDAYLATEGTTFFIKE